jgi:hypothetical protein
MLEALLRRFSRFNPTERIAALKEKLNRLEAGLQSLEQEIRSSGPSAKGIDLSPSRRCGPGSMASEPGWRPLLLMPTAFPG